MTVQQLHPSQSLEARVQRHLNRISRKLYRATVRYQRESVLYFVEARLFAWLCGQPWAQQRYWAKEVELVHTFLRRTKLLDHNPALTMSEVTQLALFGYCFSDRWFQRMTTWSPQQLAQVITVHGWEQWLAAQQRGRGVILTHYHVYPTQLVWVWLTAMGVQQLNTVRNGRMAAQEAGVVYTPEIVPFLYARQLHAAKACLEAGGAVRILPDGFGGKGGISLPFYQHMRSFRTSFAELALRTGASALPVSTTLDLHGKVAITFHAPFVIRDSRQSHSGQIEQLVQEFATFLHDAWAKTPGTIRMGYMGRFLEQATPI